jgi:molybdate transport system substrate-binding protein
MGVWEQWRGQRVVGTNIAHTFQYVATKNASLGLVAWSQVIHSQYSYEVIPESYHQPIVQKMVVLKGRGAKTHIAQQFADFLLSDEVQATLPNFGYGEAN